MKKIPGFDRARTRALRPIAMLLLAGALSASSSCGDDKKATGDQHEEGDGPYLPWAVGNTWTYRVTNNGEVTMKVVTIEAEEKVGGTGPNKDKMAFKVVTKKGEADQTISWQADENGRVLRYREQSFHEKTGELELEEHWDPYKLHFDGTEEHTQDGANWLESYEETKIYASGKEDDPSEERDRWMVDSHSETIKVPAGTFDAVVVRKAGGSDVKTYWYVRGVGKVMESGGQKEELVDFKVAP